MSLRLEDAQTQAPKFQHVTVFDGREVILCLSAGTEVDVSADAVPQLQMARDVGAAAKLLYDELAQLRSVKQQASAIGKQLKDAGYGDEAEKAAGELNEKLKAVEGELTQLEGQSSQDSLNFPGRLDQQFNGLYGGIVGNEAPIGSGVKERWADLEPQLPPLIEQIRAIYESDLVTFNELAAQNGLKVLLKKAEEGE